MAIKALKTYELDLTGSLANNLITNENQHTSAGFFRLIVQNCGCFYAKSLILNAINSNGSLTKLVRGIDYECYETNVEFTVKTGLEVVGCIVVFQNVTTNDFTLQYQALGGPDTTNVSELIESINSLSSLYPITNFKDILDKPVEGYQPGPHKHSGQDYYNTGFLVRKLNEIKQALIVNDKATHDNLYVQINKKINVKRDAGNLIINNLLNTTVADIISNTSLAQASLTSFNTLANTLENNIVQINSTNILTTNLINDQIYLTRENLYDTVLGYLDDQFISTDTLGFDTPFKISGLQLWLDTSDPAYLTKNTDNSLMWSDRSPGSRRYLSPPSNTPTIIKSISGLGNRVLKFKGTQNFAQISGQQLRLSGPFTMFLVHATSAYPNSTGLDVISSNSLVVKSDSANTRGFRIADNSDTSIVMSGLNSFSSKEASVIVANIPASSSSVGYIHTSHLSSNSVYPDGIDHSTYNPQSINTVLDHLGYTGSSTDNEGELAAIVIFNRQLVPYEVEAVLYFLKKRFNKTINLLSNPQFNLDNYGFQTDYSLRVNLSLNKSAYVVDSQYNSVFPSNVLQSATYVPLVSKYLAINGGSSSGEAFWRDTLNVDNDALYEFKFNLVYGQISPPDIRLKINGTLHSKVLNLSSGNSYLQDISYAFRVQSSTAKIELVNLNTSTVGNTFGIDSIRLSRNVYASTSYEKIYQIIFDSASFTQSSAYDGQSVTLRLNFIGMNPGSSNIITTSVSFLNSALPTDVQNNTIIADSAGNGTIDLTYVIGTVSLTATVSALSSSKTSTISNVGPLLDSVRFSSTTTYVGQPASFIARFTNVPLSGQPISASVVITNLTGNDSSFPGNYGSQNIQIVPNSTGVFEKTFTYTMSDVQSKTLRLAYKNANFSASVSTANTPVFSGLITNPSSGAIGSTSNLVASFTGLAPNLPNVIRVNSFIDSSVIDITVTADSAGNGTYAWIQTVGTSNRTFSVTSLGVTKTATLTRSFSPSFSQLLVSVPGQSNAASQTVSSGTIATITASFSNLPPNSNTTISLTKIINGASSTINITLSADGNGNATYISTVSAPAIDTSYSFVAYGSNRTIVLNSLYIPTFSSAVFTKSSDYAGRSNTLRLTFTGMRPSYTSSVPVSLTVTSDYNVNGALAPSNYLIAANASGVGLLDVTYTVTSSGLSITCVSQSQTRLATCSNIKPILTNVSVTPTAQVVGGTVTLSATFSTVPDNGEDLSINISILGIDSTYLSGPSGTQTVTFIPNGSSVITKTFTYTLASTPRPEVIQVSYDGVTLNAAPISLGWNPIIESVNFIDPSTNLPVSSIGATDVGQSNVYINLKLINLEPNATVLVPFSIASVSGVIGFSAYGASNNAGYVVADANGVGYVKSLLSLNILGLKIISATTIGTLAKSQVLINIPISSANGQIYSRNFITDSLNSFDVSSSTPVNIRPNAARAGFRSLGDGTIGKYYNEFGSYTIKNILYLTSYLKPNNVNVQWSYTLAEYYSDLSNFEIKISKRLNLPMTGSIAGIFDTWSPFSQVKEVSVGPMLDVNTGIWAEGDLTIDVQIRYIPTGEIVTTFMSHLTATH